MLRRNPMAALEMHVPAATLPPGTPPRVMDDEDGASIMRAVRPRVQRRPARLALRLAVLFTPCRLSPPVDPTTPPS